MAGSVLLDWTISWFKGSWFRTLVNFSGSGCGEGCCFANNGLGGCKLFTTLAFVLFNSDIFSKLSLLS